MGKDDFLKQQIREKRAYLFLRSSASSKDSSALAEPVVPYGSMPDSISDYYMPGLVAKGVESDTADLIARSLDWSQKQISDTLHISDRSYRMHLKDRKAFTGMEAEMVITLINLLQEGLATFEDLGPFRAWLNLEIEALNYKKPVDFLNTISGVRYVTDLLRTIQAGAFA